MARTVYDQYLESEVWGAAPVELVCLLYRGCIDAVRDARRHLAQRAIRERSRQVSKAWGILQELAATLDTEQGGDIAHRLAGLYAYMQTRLMEGNIQQQDAPLQEVENLLVTLSEGWHSAARAVEEEAVLVG